MKTLAVARLLSLVSACAASAAILKMSAQLIRVWPTTAFPLATYAKLTFITSTFSAVSLLAMLLIDIFWKGRAFTSWIVVEIVWLNMLWVLWLSSAQSNATFNPFTHGLYDWNFYHIGEPWPDRKTMEILSFLVGGILMAYALTLSGLTLIGWSRGNCGWTSTVRDATFLSQSPVDHVEGAHITKPAAGVVQSKDVKRL